MSSELREAVVVGIELILFSLLIIIVAFFGKYSQDALITKTKQEDASHAIEEYSDIFEFTGGAEIDYAMFFSDGYDKLYKPYGIKEMKRTTAGSYQNLTETNILAIYRQVRGDMSLTKQNLPKFYLTTGDDIVRFIALYGMKYDIVVSNISYYEPTDKSKSKEYKTVVFTDIDSLDRKGVEYIQSGNVRVVKLSELSNNYKSIENENKEKVNYLTVHEYLGTELTSEFYCIGMYDSAYHTYDSIIFYKKT